MLLVDTSVWIDHLRLKDAQLIKLLERSQVTIHPMIIGDIACGYLNHRQQLFKLWKNLPCVTEATHHEALHCLEINQLMAKGIGFIDLHLLASTLLTSNTSFWTGDRRLHHLAEKLNVCWKSVH